MAFKEFYLKFTHYEKDDKYIYYIHEIIIKIVNSDPNQVLPHVFVLVTPKRVGNTYTYTFLTRFV